MSEENDNKESSENTDESSELEKQKGLGKKKLIIIFAGAALLIIIVAVVLFFFLFGKDKEEEKLENTVNNVDSAVVTPAQDFYPDLFKMPETKFKLAPEEGSEIEKFLRISFYVKLKNSEDKFLLVDNADLLKNRITSVFEQKKPSDIDEIYEKILLKKKIIRLISDVLKKDSVENIYYSEFLILDW